MQMRMWMAPLLDNALYDDLLKALCDFLSDNRGWSSNMFKVQIHLQCTVFRARSGHNLLDKIATLRQHSN